MSLHNAMKESEVRRDALKDKVQALKFELFDAERRLKYEVDHLDELIEAAFRKAHLQAGGFTT